MSTIICTISDEELYLKHHGIKGQKWGVEHGPPYPLDQKVAKKIVDAADKADKMKIYVGTDKAKYVREKRESNISKVPEVKDAIKNAKSQLKNEIDEYYDAKKELDKYISDYEKNENVYKCANGLVTGKTYTTNSNNVGKMSLADAGHYAYYSNMDDGDQGSDNSRIIFAKTNNAKHIYEQSAKFMNAYRKMDSSLSDIVRDMTGKRTYDSSSLSEAQDAMTRVLSKGVYGNTSWNKINSFAYNVIDGTSKEERSYPDAIKYGTKIAKITKGDAYNWLYFDTAVDNLGFSSRELETISDAEWDKINDEIIKLKR